MRRIEFDIPATVERGKTISELAMTLDQHESYLSGTVADLAIGLLKRDIIRKAAIGPGNASLFDFVIDPTQMLAAPLGRSLLPVGARTRLVDDVDFVPVPGRGLHLVATTFREEGNVHRFVDGTLRPWLKGIL